MTELRYRGFQDTRDRSTSDTTSDVLKKIEPIFERENRYHYEVGIEEGRTRGFICGFIAGCISIALLANSVCK